MTAHHVAHMPSRWPQSAWMLDHDGTREAATKSSRYPMGLPLELANQCVIPWDPAKSAPDAPEGVSTTGGNGMAIEAACKRC